MLSALAWLCLLLLAIVWRFIWILFSVDCLNKYKYKYKSKYRKMNRYKKVDCLSWSKLMSICFSSNSTPEDFSISILEVEKIRSEISVF